MLGQLLHDGSSRRMRRGPLGASRNAWLRALAWVQIGRLQSSEGYTDEMNISLAFSTLVSVIGLASLSCGGGSQVSSEEQARRAYVGLDKAVGKSMQLGFDGFNSASSANISPQTGPGMKSGTLTVTGQVDQGASANKGMRLKVGMTNYSDGDVAVDGGSSVAITYATIEGGTQPALDLSLKNVPNGTFTGTLVGDFEMSGGLSGSVKLDLSLSGAIEDAGGGKVQRKSGSTSVTGKTTSGTGVFQVDITL